MSLLLGVDPLIRVVEVVKEQGHVRFVVFGQEIEDRVLFVDLDLDKTGCGIWLIRFKVLKGGGGFILKTLVFLLYYLVLDGSLSDRSYPNRG